MTSELFRNPAARSWRCEAPAGVADFHATLPGFARSPLTELPALAAELGVARVFVKDESTRMGLPAFKILGASYAVARALTAHVGGDAPAPEGPPLPLDELRAALAPSDMTLVAATDGNHGRAVARMARLLDLESRIFVPGTLTDTARDAIAAEGARVTQLDRPYDDVVAAAADWAATTPGAVLIQDTSWPDYHEIPAWIVDGYDTLFAEMDEQLAELGAPAPEIVAVPVGVGSLAHAAVRHYRSGTHRPMLLSVEASAAPAILESLRNGTATSVATAPTIMSGLNCGTPSDTAWPDLEAGIDAAVTVDDTEAARAVRELAALGVDAGPCGAATLAGARALVASEPLPRTATLVLLSTEGTAANPLPTQ